MDAEGKNNIVSQIDCCNSKAVYFSESKRFLKSQSDEKKRSVKKCDCEKNENVWHCWKEYYNFSWDQKEVVDKESRLITRKFKETFLKNTYLIDQVS